VALSSLTGEFQTTSVPVPAPSGRFDPDTIALTRIKVEAGDGFGTSCQQPETIVVIDRISTSNGAFDEGIAPLEHSGARLLEGATITWEQSYSGNP
jgi:hypothetical protein